MYLLNYVWADKSTIHDAQIAILYLLASTTLSEDVVDGHNRRYKDQQHFSLAENNAIPPDWSDDFECIDALSDLDSLIEDKLEDTDHFNRQTFSSDRYPSSKYPANSAINYLSSFKPSRKGDFDYLFEGQ
eukprot:508829-Ditylum_brightwellii.AAC.1